MVIGSSMPRLLAGPCRSVILPAPSSIFLTAPLMAEVCANATGIINATANIAAAVARTIFFIIFSFALGFLLFISRDLTDHPVVAMVGDQAGIFERPHLSEFPDGLCRLR